MKQVTLVLHFDDNEKAKEVYDLLRAVRTHAPEGTPLMIAHPGKIVDVQIKGPND